MKRAGVARVTVRKVQRGRAILEKDALAVEEPLEIRAVRGSTRRRRMESIAVTMRTPGNDFELAAGFLYTEGILRSADDLDRIEYAKESSADGPNVVEVRLRRGASFDLSLARRNFFTTSSCGVCGKASLEAIRVRGVPAMPPTRPFVPQAAVQDLPDRLRGAQAIFAETGGLHAAALFDSAGVIEQSREDVGRHNAVDKVIGREVLEDRLPLFDYGLVVSGRASFEILQKAAVAGIPFVVAVGAPSSLAVSTATEFGMTLVGFAREDRFNVYAGPQRIQATDRQGGQAASSADVGA